MQLTHKPLATIHAYRKKSLENSHTHTHSNNLTSYMYLYQYIILAHVSHMVCAFYTHVTPVKGNNGFSIAYALKGYNLRACETLIIVILVTAVLIQTIRLYNVLTRRNPQTP